MPVTVETEPLDVAAATEAVDEAATLRIHDGDDVVDAAEETATDEPVAEAATIDYDDAIASVAAEQAEAAATAETTTTNTATPVAVQVAKPIDEAATKLREITQVSEEVRRNRERVALIKDELKEAKEDLQGSVNRLMRITAAISNDEARPLLAAAEKPAEVVDPLTNSQREAAAQGLVDVLAGAPAPAAEPLPSPSTEAWRSYRFDDATHFPALAAQKAIVAKLAENSPPINTIGDLLDFQKPVGDYSKGLTDIKGIGTGKAEKIENALEQFWADHPELVQEAVDAS